MVQEKSDYRVEFVNVVPYMVQIDYLIQCTYHPLGLYPLGHGNRRK